MFVHVNFKQFEVYTNFFLTCALKKNSLITIRLHLHRQKKAYYATCFMPLFQGQWFE